MSRQQIKEMVQLAISKAKSWSEIEPHEKQQEELVKQFLTNKISYDQFYQKIHSLENNIGTVHFYSINDFIFALECCGATEKQIDGILKEQMPRYKAGVNSSLSTRFSITPYKTAGGQLVLIPGIQSRIDQLMKDEIVHAALQRIQSL